MSEENYEYDPYGEENNYYYNENENLGLEQKSSTVCEEDSGKLNLKKTQSGIGKEEEARYMMEKIVDELVSITCLSSDDALLLLIQNNWNKERIETFWFDDTEKNRVKFGLDLDKSLKLELLGKKECVVCCDKITSNSFALKCDHTFCSSCWKEYLEHKVDERLNTVFTTCMLKDCNVFVPYSIFQKFLSEKVFNSYKILVLKNFTEHNDDIKWCPTSGCGRFVKSKNHAPRDVTCECLTVFCFKCMRDGHRPCQCLLMDIWDKKNNSDGENVLWLQANTKQCPSCNKHIEKNQGCNHMTCRKTAGGCGYEFCWICMGEWKPHGSEWYNCNKFDPKNEKNQQKERDTQKIKSELDKFAHYFDRSYNHNKSMKFNINLRGVIEKKKSEFNDIRKINMNELTFLSEALEIVIKCHMTLKNTYIFGYYMDENASSEKTLFEYQLKLLSDNCDKLNEMLENNEIQELLNIEHVDKFINEFNKFRAKVMALAAVTEKFNSNLTDFVENSLIDYIHYNEINK